MRAWVYGAVMLIGLAGPPLLTRCSRRRHDGQERSWFFGASNLPSRLRFLFEGRTRFVGYAVSGALTLAVIVIASWYLTQPNYAKGADQMHPAPGIPAWLPYPVAAIAWIAMMCDVVYAGERFEAGRSRRLREQGGSGRGEETMSGDRRGRSDVE